VEQILNTVRAFGRFECLATVNGARVYVAQAAGWQEAHSAMPGTVVHAYGLATVVACRDGHIAMLDWHLFGANAVTGTTAR
jgi:methionyl-tRNA formyltransferase